MADLVDQSDERAELLLQADLRIIRNKASLMPIGEAGDCDKCGEASLRLIYGNCARCRDKYKLP